MGENALNLKAYNDALIVELYEMGEKTVGECGIILSTDYEAEQMDRGTVIDQGPLAFLDYKKYYDLEVPNLVGKEVLFERNPTEEMYFDLSLKNGKKYKVVLDRSIRCLVEQEVEDE